MTAPPTARVGFWLRVTASALDMVVLLPLLFAYGFVLVHLDETGRLTPTIERVADVTLILLAVAYSSMEVFAEGTLGKRILKLQIADAAGHAADPWKLALRWST